jgi:hypothetical protein
MAKNIAALYAKSEQQKADAILRMKYVEEEVAPIKKATHQAHLDSAAQAKAKQNGLAAAVLSNDWVGFNELISQVSKPDPILQNPTLLVNGIHKAISGYDADKFMESCFGPPVDQTFANLFQPNDPFADLIGQVFGVERS